MRASWVAGALGCLLVLGPASAQDFYTLEDVVKEISDDPNVVADVLRRLGRNPAAAGLISADQKRQLMAAIKAGNYAALDHFPTMTLDELGRTVDAVGAASKARNLRRAGADQKRPRVKGLGAGPLQARNLIWEPLGIPTGQDPLSTGSMLKDLGYGLQYGDQVDPDKAARHPDSARLADVLNRLAENDPASKGDRFQVEVGDARVDSVPALLKALEASGHSVEVRDARYVANFGDLRFKGKDVSTPFWIDTEVPVPGAERNLRVPAAHSQHELIVRGPKVNTDISFFFGIDGEAKFRAMSGKGQGWVGGVTKQVYTGDEAIEAARLAGEVHRTFVAKKAANPDLPYGGYYALGVCNDSNALIELHMTGKTTLYPLTRELKYFQEDTEVDRLARRLPVDGRGNEASEDHMERILGSIPYANADAIPWADTRDDLRKVVGGEPQLSESAGAAGQDVFQKDQKKR